MSAADDIHAADQARHELTLLDPAVDAIIEAYTQRMIEIAAETPWETGKITKLAQAVKITRTIRAHLTATVANGNVAETNQRHAAKIASLPDKKRWLGIGR